MPKTNPLSQLESKSRVISGAAANSVASNVTLHSSPLNAEFNSATINLTVQGIIDEGGLIGENGLVGRDGLIGENGIPVFNNNSLIGEGDLVASLQDAQTRSTPIQSSPQPTLLTDLDDPNSVYTVLTGLKTGSPTVVFTSEFIPLYEPLELSSNAKLTTQGNSLRLKQEAKLITAATAVSVLSQSLPVQNLANTNKQNIKNFLDYLGTGKKTDISNFVSELYDLSPKFNPSSYTFSPPAAPKFSILLSRLGYRFSDISKFSETKIWLQALFELKKSLLTHTPSIQSYDRSVGRNSVYDNDTNLISKFVGERIVLNMSAPNLPLLEGKEISEIVNSYPEYKDAYALYDSIMYSKLNKLEDLSDTDFRVGTYVLRPDDEIDFSIAASNVLKEIKYCDNFAEDYIRPTLQSDFSYPITERNNYKVWDTLIGRIPSNARDTLTDFNSLSSLCQFSDVSGETSVAVYTFEKIPTTGESINSNVGFRYFIEGSLDTLDTTGQANVNRITVLEQKCVKSLKAVNTMISIVGADNLGAYSSLIDRVFKRLSSENNSPGWMYLKNTTSNFLPNEIRIPSLIMKLSLRTDVPYLRSLKMHLFTWFYFQARKISEPSRDYSSSIQFALDKVLEDVYGLRVPSRPGDLETVVYRVRRGYLTGTPADDVDNLFKRYVRELLEDSPVTKLILNEFVSFLNDLRPAAINGSTSYSGLQLEKMMYAYFDVMMRAIAFQTVESIEKVYTFDAPSNVSEIGITIKLVERSNYDSYYERGYVSGPTLNYLKRLKSVYANVYQDALNKSQHLQTFKSVLERLRDAAIRAKSLISGNRSLKRYYDVFNQVFDAEDKTFFQDPSATKTRMFKYSLSPGQARNLDYVHSEMRERINDSRGMQNSLRQTPTISGLFPSKDFDNFLPINSISLVTHQILSKIYNNISFQPIKGNNKRIISVGIPQGLVDKIQSESSSRNPVASGLVTLKVWKIDRLYPDILFRPLTYVFDMNLYPTRIPSNWDFETLTRSPDVLKIPLKYYSPTSKYFYVKSRFMSPNDPEFLTSMEQQDITYLNLALPDETKREATLKKIYENQALSYLCEEYLGWYTDEDFSEMQYHNYYNKPSTPGKETYQEVIDTLRTDIPSFAQNLVKFTDFSTGQVINFPASTLQATSTTPSRVSSPVQTVDLTDTAVSYLRNLSFMSKVQNIKKRVIFPKKFERVFSILIDPDDFQIERTFDAVKKDKLLSGPFEEVSGVMKRKETAPDEISLNEFFVTIEPFDYDSTRNT
jgi:hypothetical protein